MTIDFLTHTKPETLVQFQDKKVEIFNYTDERKWYANVTIGDYTVKNRKIKLPFGIFETTRARDGYYLYLNGILKYKLIHTSGNI